MTDRPPLPHDERKVRAELQQRIVPLLLALGYREAQRGPALITPLNPWREDRKPGSYVIWLDAGREGAWKDFATLDQGDVYDLIRRTKGLAGWIDAYWWALDFLGLGRGEVRSASQVQKDRERAEADAKAAAARQKADEAAKGRAAKAQWLGADPNVIGTPAWRYLTERLKTEKRPDPMSLLAHVPHALRGFAKLEHFDKLTGEVTDWPAMAWCFTMPRIGETPGGITGVHLTWLAPDGSGKAPVEKPKKMRGVVRGAAIRVWKGATKLSPEEAIAKDRPGPLVITEGLEDALSAVLAMPSNRVWCAGSLSLMHELVKAGGWPLCASGVILVRDNDWDKPQAVEAFDACEADWRRAAAGRPVKVVSAPDGRGKDLNDWLRGAAA